jgi:hypothetical protein
MDFLCTPTTVFENVQFDQIEFATARLKTKKWSSYHYHLQHELYGGELVGVPPTLCTTSDKMYGIAQIVAPELHGDRGCQVKSCFGQIVSFRRKIDPTSEVMTHYARVNLYCRHNEPPPCIQGTMTCLSMVPYSQSTVQTHIIKEYPLLYVYSVGNVHHATRISWKSMAGVFNTFGMRYRFDCTTASLSSIDSSRHVGSPCDLYGKDFVCLSKKTFEKCLQINEKTFKMLNCISAGQLKTNLVPIDMEPGMWWMLFTHMQKPSALASPTHLVYYTDQSTTSLRHSVESTRARTLQCLTDVLPDREVRVR